MAERPDGPTRGPEWRAALAWFAVALALRLLFLGRFSLWGDEDYSLDDALRWGTTHLRPNQLLYPLFFLLERGALEVGGFVDVAHPDPRRMQWWLRIVPALAGAAAAAAIFVGPRGLVDRRARHVMAAIVTFSPWLLFFSQFARFYTLLLALATPACFGMVRAWRDADLRAGVVAAAWFLLAVLTHPTALLLLAGHLAGVAAVALLVRPRAAKPPPAVDERPAFERLAGLAGLAGLARWRGLFGPLALLLLLAIPALVRTDLVNKVLVYRFTAQDAAESSVVGLLRGIGYNFGPLIGALALLGLVLLWRRDRALCVHVAVAIAVPLVGLTVMAALHKSVDERYMMALLPLALLPAGLLVSDLAGRVAARRAGAILVPLAALAPFAPGVLSNYFDGDRPDMGQAADWVAARLAPGDGIISDTHRLMRRYLPESFSDDLLLEAPPPPMPEDVAKHDRMWSGCPRLWVVVPATFEDQSAETRRFQEWAWREGRLQAQIGMPRLDYHQNQLRVFLVEPKHAARWPGDASAR
jgi:hypothetical protein